MGDNYIKVGEYENDADAIELPIESDGTIFLSSVSAQFPGACGLKYRNPQSQSVRGLKLIDGAIYLPNDDNWQEHTYLVVYPKDNKRKMEDEDSSSTRSKRPAQKCSDLIVLGLPWKVTEDDLKQYFSSYGELTVTMIKKDSTGKSKGYGFIRYTTYDAQKKVLGQTHNIHGRICDVKIPHSKEEPGSSPKIYVGRVTENMSQDDIRTYFEQFGEVLDVYIPNPFRAFAFVTFRESSVAQSLIGEDHIIQNVSVTINSATPKSKNDGQQNGNNAPLNPIQPFNYPGFGAGGAGMTGAGSSNRNDVNNFAAAQAGNRGVANMANPYGQMQFPGAPGADMSQAGANGAAGFGMMNPAVLAAALGSWNTMLNGMLGSDPSKTQTGGRGDTGGNWRNPSDGSNWNLKQ